MAYSVDATSRLSVTGSSASSWNHCSSTRCKSPWHSSAKTRDPSWRKQNGINNQICNFWKRLTWNIRRLFCGVRVNATIALIIRGHEPEKRSSGQYSLNTSILPCFLCHWSTGANYDSFHNRRTISGKASFISTFTLLYRRHIHTLRINFNSKPLNSRIVGFT